MIKKFLLTSLILGIFTNSFSQTKLDPCEDIFVDKKNGIQSYTNVVQPIVLIQSQASASSPKEYFLQVKLTDTHGVTEATGVKVLRADGKLLSFPEAEIKITKGDDDDFYTYTSFVPLRVTEAAGFALHRVAIIEMFAFKRDLEKELAEFFKDQVHCMLFGIK